MANHRNTSVSNPVCLLVFLPACLSACMSIFLCSISRSVEVRLDVTNVSSVMKIIAALRMVETGLALWQHLHRGLPQAQRDMTAADAATVTTLLSQQLSVSPPTPPSPHGQASGGGAAPGVDSAIIVTGSEVEALSLQVAMLCQCACEGLLLLVGQSRAGATQAVAVGLDAGAGGSDHRLELGDAGACGQVARLLQSALLLAGPAGDQCLAALLGAGDMAGDILFPALMMLAAMFFTSLYFTFRDCFEPEVDTTA